MLNFHLYISSRRASVIFKSNILSDPFSPDDEPPKEGGVEAYKRLYLLMTVGIQIVVSIMIGLGIGFFLDKWLDTKPWFILIFIFFGVAAGFLNVYRMVVKEGNK